LLAAFCVDELIRTKGALIFNQTTKGAHIKEGRD